MRERTTLIRRYVGISTSQLLAFQEKKSLLKEDRSSDWCHSCKILSKHIVQAILFSIKSMARNASLCRVPFSPPTSLTKTSFNLQISSGSRLLIMRSSSSSSFGMGYAFFRGNISMSHIIRHYLAFMCLDAQVRAPLMGTTDVQHGSRRGIRVIPTPMSKIARSTHVNDSSYRPISI